MAIDADLTGSIVDLISGGVITEGSGAVITAATLTGSSVGDTTLNDANLITHLGALTSGGAFALTNAQTLTVNGTVDTDTAPGTTNTATAGDLTLTTTTSGDQSLGGNLIGHTVTLTSAGTINQTGGIITALNLTGVFRR